jgi:broad specificity phosphatase PhoE
MPTILLIRHAQGSFGSADYDVLSELGHQQIAALVAGLERRGLVPARVISGDLRRQRETAEPCAAAAGLEVALDERWNEFDDADVMAHHSASLARLERQPLDDSPPLSSREFQAILDEGLQAWVSAGAASQCRQPWPSFLGEVRSALDDVAAELSSGEAAVVVSSSGVIAALATSLFGLPPEAFVALNHVAVNTGVSKVVLGRRGLTMVSYNEHAHLEEPGGRLVSYR